MGGGVGGGGGVAGVGHDPFGRARRSTMLDMPTVGATMIEQPDPMAPMGAKGVGEPPCISSTPAIVAAIRDAIGRDLCRLLSQEPTHRPRSLGREPPSIPSS